MRPLPLIDPRPPRLSEMGDGLRRIEASGVFSNGGPEVKAFEAEATERLFGGSGESLAVANATLGLMIAIREAAGLTPAPGALALMPALTFAATAQAAAWAGLTPLVADIDPERWHLCPKTEEQLLERYRGRIAVIVPYATFGDTLDRDRYAWLARRHEVGVVIDAAASLGTLDAAGRQFGTGAPFAVVYSMHATKTFAVGEGGLIHCADPDRIARLRAMTNFGFEAGRSATLPGINAKLPEVLGLMARAKLAELDRVGSHRDRLQAAYRDELSGFDLQRLEGRRHAMQFMPVQLPNTLADRRDAVAAQLEAQGIGCGRYFSPHLGEQPWIRSHALIEPTPVADAVAARMMSLPITDAMTEADAARAAASFRQACAAVRPRRRTAPRPTPISPVMVIGGGPAGTALLTAAAKRGELDRLAAAGLVMVERSDRLGGGRLGRYAITSDSTAQTFLTAVRGNPHPTLAALADHPSARAVAAHEHDLGVPLTTAGPLIAATGEELARIVRQGGGEVLTGHEAVRARRTKSGTWQVTLRRVDDGALIERQAHQLVLATGGEQPLDRLAAQRVAGAPLVEIAAGRLLQSDEVLAEGGVARLRDLLADRPAPRIAVIGGSTSALATIALLLKAQPALAFGAGALSLIHRRPLRPFYPSADAALTDGFTDFTRDDVCPVSNFVYRLGGFRLEARELVLRMLGIGGRAADPRVAVHQLAGEGDETARHIITEADLVIAAMGYRPIALPLKNADGTPIALRAHGGGALVDRYCRIVDPSGEPLPSLFGIGLAAGFVPWGPMGGEPSFRGQANGLWQWQNDVGGLIVDQLLAPAARAAA